MESVVWDVIAFRLIFLFTSSSFSQWNKNRAYQWTKQIFVLNLFFLTQNGFNFHVMWFIWYFHLLQRLFFFLIFISDWIGIQLQLVSVRAIIAWGYRFLLFFFFHYFTLGDILFLTVFDNLLRFLWKYCIALSSRLEKVFLFFLFLCFQSSAD